MIFLEFKQSFYFLNLRFQVCGKNIEFLWDTLKINQKADLEHVLAKFIPYFVITFCGLSACGRILFIKVSDEKFEHCVLLFV